MQIKKIGTFSILIMGNIIIKLYNIALIQGYNSNLILLDQF